MATIGPSTALIDMKYEDNISEATADLKEFWSKRNVQKLSGFYQIWAKDLARNKMDAMKVIDQFFQTLQDLFDLDSDGKARIQKEKGTGINSRLLTIAELENETASLKVKLIHQTSMDVFKHTDPNKEGFHEQKIQSSYRFLNNFQERSIEQSIHFGELNLVDQGKLNALNREVKTLLDNIDFSSHFRQSIRTLLSEADFIADPQSETPHPTATAILTYLDNSNFSHPDISKIRELLTSQEFGSKHVAEITELINQIEYTLPKASTIKKVYDEKIKIFKKAGLTHVNEYVNWAQTLQLLRQKAHKYFSVSPSKSPSERHLSKYLAEVITEENKVHATAHQHSLESAPLLGPLNSLKKAGVSALFRTHLRAEEIILFDTQRNKFVAVDQKSHKYDDKDVDICLQQIKKFIYLLTHRNQDAIKEARAAFGERFSIANALKHLLETMNQIEVVHGAENKKYKRPHLAKAVDTEVQSLITSQINGAFQSAKIRSAKKGILQLDSLFQKGGSPNFYLKLAIDLEILPNVTPKGIPVEVIIKLADAVEREDTWIDEKTFLDKTAIDENHVQALESYKRIKEIEGKIHRTPTLKILYTKELSSHSETLKKILNEQAKGLFSYLFDLSHSCLTESDLDLNDPQLTLIELEGKRKKIAEKADDLYASIFVGDLNDKFPKELFYFDLALRAPFFNFSFNGKELNRLQIAVLNKIISHYRLHIQRTIISSRNLTPLEEIVPKITVESNPEIGSAQIDKSIKKLREKLTEILLHGLRTYHSMFASLTTYLDWKEEDLQAEFVNHVLRKKIIRDQKLQQPPTPAVLEAYKLKTYKGNLSLIPQAVKTEAKSLRLEFCNYLESYRSIQREHYKFYSALGNVLIRNQNVFDLPALNTGDIDFLEKHFDPDNTAFLNDMDLKVANHLKPHLSAIRQLIEDTPKDGQAKAFFNYIRPLMTASGVPFTYTQVSYINLKLLIRTIRIIKRGENIKGLNIKEFENVFTASNSPWKQFAQQTQVATSAFVEKDLDAFISKKERLEKLRFFTDLRPSTQADQMHLWEYFGFAPIRMTIASVNTLAKWNGFKDDLLKRVRPKIIQKSIDAIVGASSRMNEDIKFRESMKDSRRVTILKSTL